MNTSNYFEQIRSIDFSTLPEALRNGDKLARSASQNGWSAYNSNDNIRRVIDLYFEKLDHYMESNTTIVPQFVPEPEKPEVVVKKEKPVKAKREKRTVTAKQEKKKVPEKEPVTEKEIESYADNVPLEIKFIRKFLHLQKTTITRQFLGKFLKDVQKAFAERTVKKTSDWKDEIEKIEKNLLREYNRHAEQYTVEIDEKLVTRLTVILEGFKVSPSILFIKRFLGFYTKEYGTEITTGSARRLVVQIKKAFDRGIIAKSDKHYERLNKILGKLTKLSEDKKYKLTIDEMELSGFMGIAGQEKKKTRR